jgi:hypothetical protein
MKGILLIFAAATLGGVVGSILTAQFTTAKAADTRTIAVHELVLLNDQNNKAASLTSVDGKSVLSFFDRSGKPDVEVGVDLRDGSRFLVFRGEKGSVTAAISSKPPHSEATLALGDDSWEGKVVLGAFQSDTPGMPQADDWGLRLWRTGELHPAFDLLVEQKSVAEQRGRQLRTSMSIPRSDGTYWSVP